ncbi:nodulation protein NfeD [Pseudomonas sp. Fl5BN2]|uniref:NfeD family protein n=1 Tax=unclassified Pseudomonas TaxID=196821 RepID=UPI00137875C9|nr:MULTISPECIES: nodulation protein NfeD [unclassified Pseudomonas]NBF06608.1 nodulation protein NfeD [Pseudomonas sp. Fl5BN2]NBF12327.1 nodulation protein NfeD [Pseudomonas sp. Fl4BN1]
MNRGGWLALWLGLLIGSSAGAAQAVDPVVVLTVSDVITPASADYLVRGLNQAADEHAQLVVIRLDTPGGLDTSMRTIIQAILASPVPVASFVAPSGARAASAGTYILYASHIAAMTPGTNLGAATPVQLGLLPEPPSAAPNTHNPPTNASHSSLELKQINDAAAYIRSLAQLRGRNVEWAEQAVREAVTLSAQEALNIKVVDYVANDLDSLLKQADGKTLVGAGHEVQLHTQGAALIQHDPDWRTRLLSVITHPSIAMILMMIGVYGLFFEFVNPGTTLPGVLGGICLLLGLYAMQLLPVNYAGVALILLGIGLMVAEAFLPTFGVIGLGGIAAFVVGSVILIDTDVPGYGIPLPLIIGLALLSAIVLVALAGLAIRSRRRPTVSGDAGLVGSLTPINSVQPGNAYAGRVLLQGEHWQVASATPLSTGLRVRVVARKGLLLEVTPAEAASRGG